MVVECLDALGVLRGEDDHDVDAAVGALGADRAEDACHVAGQVFHGAVVDLVPRVKVGGT